MKKRKVLNISMAVLTVVVMSYQATGGPFHEAAGVLLLLLYISHNILNRNLYLPDDICSTMGNAWVLSDTADSRCCRCMGTDLGIVSLWNAYQKV